MARNLFFKPAGAAPENGEVICDGQAVAYTIIRSKKRKRSIALSLSDTQTLRINVPHRTPHSTIQRLLRERESWIGKTYSAMQSRRHLHQSMHFEDGMQLPYLGNFITLSVCYLPSEKRFTQLDGGMLRINLRNNNLSPDAQRDHLRATILKWYKNTAFTHIQTRLNELAQRMNLHYTSLKLNNATRLWGSCTYTNLIRINWRILLATPEALDYLLVHELAHVRHKNHSNKFWNMVATYIPDYTAQRHYLKTQGRAFLETFRAD